jgi:hypothetical protein
MTNTLAYYEKSFITLGPAAVDITYLFPLLSPTSIKACLQHNKNHAKLAGFNNENYFSCSLKMTES